MITFQRWEVVGEGELVLIYTDETGKEIAFPAINTEKGEE